MISKNIHKKEDLEQSNADWNSIKNEIKRKLQEERVAIIITQRFHKEFYEGFIYYLKECLASYTSIILTEPYDSMVEYVYHKCLESFPTSLKTEIGFDILWKKNNELEKMVIVKNELFIHKLTSIASKMNLVIIDNAQEKSWGSDMLIGLIPYLLTTYANVKFVIINDANDEKNELATILNCGSVYNIDSKFNEIAEMYDSDQFNIITNSAETVYKIHSCDTFLTGNILVIMTTLTEMEQLKQLILINCQNINVFIIHEHNDYQSSMTELEVGHNYEIDGRCVYIASDVMSKSVEFPCIKFVVDSGIVEEYSYDSDLNVYTFRNVKVTKQQSVIRSNLAGNYDGNGSIYRLYSTDQCQKHAQTQLLRMDLKNVYLALINLDRSLLTKNFNSIKWPTKFNYDFLNTTSLMVQQKFQFTNDKNELTDVGRMAVKIPLNIKLQKFLLLAQSRRCYGDALIVGSFLHFSTMRLFKRQQNNESLLQFISQNSFSDDNGDCFTMLKIYKKWLDVKQSVDWCNKFGLNAEMLNRVHLLVDRMKDILSCDNDQFDGYPVENGKELRECLMELDDHICELQEKNGVYVNIKTGTQMYIHPSSVLFHLRPNVVTYYEAIKTTKLYMHKVTSLEGIVETQTSTKSQKKEESKGEFNIPYGSHVFHNNNNVDYTFLFIPKILILFFSFMFMIISIFSYKWMYSKNNV